VSFSPLMIGSRAPTPAKTHFVLGHPWWTPSPVGPYSRSCPLSFDVPSIEGGSLAVYSDYSGASKATTYRVMALLCFGPEAAGRWEAADASGAHTIYATADAWPTSD